MDSEDRAMPWPHHLNDGPLSNVRLEGAGEKRRKPLPYGVQKLLVSPSIRRFSFGVPDPAVASLVEHPSTSADFVPPTTSMPPSRTPRSRPSGEVDRPPSAQSSHSRSHHHHSSHLGNDADLSTSSRTNRRATQPAPSGHDRATRSNSTRHSQPASVRRGSDARAPAHEGSRRSSRIADRNDTDTNPNNIPLPENGRVRGHDNAGRNRSGRGSRGNPGSQQLQQNSSRNTGSSRHQEKQTRSAAEHASTPRGRQYRGFGSSDRRGGRGYNVNNTPYYSNPRDNRKSSASSISPGSQRERPGPAYSGYGSEEGEVYEGNGDIPPNDLMFPGASIQPSFAPRSGIFSESDYINYYPRPGTPLESEPHSLEPEEEFGVAITVNQTPASTSQKVLESDQLGNDKKLEKQDAKVVSTGHGTPAKHATQAVKKYLETPSNAPQKAGLESDPKESRSTGSSSSGLSSPPSSTEKKQYEPRTPAKSPTLLQGNDIPPVSANTYIHQNEDVLNPRAAAKISFSEKTGPSLANKNPVPDQASVAEDNNKKETGKYTTRSRKKREEEKRQKAARDGSVERETPRPLQVVGTPEEPEETHEVDTGTAPSGPYGGWTVEAWLNGVETFLGYPRYCVVSSNLVGWKESRIDTKTMITEITHHIESHEGLLQGFQQICAASAYCGPNGEVAKEAYGDVPRYDT